MAQHIRTLPFLVVLPLLFAAASFGQSSDPASEEMGIPIGHKVIAMKFPSGSTLGHLHKGDLVQVISGAADSEPIARNIRVFAEPNPLKNKVGGSCIVHLLVSGKIADQILRAHKIGQIRLVLPGGTQISLRRISKQILMKVVARLSLLPIPTKSQKCVNLRANLMRLLLILSHSKGTREQMSYVSTLRISGSMYVEKNRLIKRL